MSHFTYQRKQNIVLQRLFSEPLNSFIRYQSVSILNVSIDSPNSLIDSCLGDRANEPIV